MIKYIQSTLTDLRQFPSPDNLQTELNQKNKMSRISKNKHEMLSKDTLTK
jgi:hypothetical protein